MAGQVELKSILDVLVGGPAIRLRSLETASREQGVYALWHQGPTETCLKVGIAGPRRGNGLRERLALHFSSNLNSSVLAEHLAKDAQSTWVAGREFGDRAVRQRFLSHECLFRAAAVPGLARSELLALERHLVRELRPIYTGRIISRLSAG